MPDRRRFLQAAACASLLAQPWAARALTTRQPMLARPIWSTGEMLPVVGLGTADTFNVSPSDAAAMAPLAQVVDALLDGRGSLIDTAPAMAWQRPSPARCWRASRTGVRRYSWPPRSASRATMRPGARSNSRGARCAPTSST